MILVKRVSDNMIMNDRQSSDWPKHEKLADLQSQLADAPGNTDPDVIDRLQQAIDTLQTDLYIWQGRRINAVCKMYGGTLSDYVCVPVAEADEWKALTARWIEDVDGVPVYHMAPEKTVDGLTVIVSAGWVKGNYRLMQDDITDFSTVDTPLNFALIFAQNVQTQDISVQILVRGDDEEFGDLPSNLILLRIIMEGTVNVNGTITETGVI